MNKKKSISYSKYGYIFVIPFLVAWLVFQLYPTLYTMIIGFTDLKGVNKTSFHFLTNDLFANYKEILASKTFRLGFVNTFRIWISNFIPQMVLALFLAAAFTNSRLKTPCVGLFKVLFYMPNIITASTVAILFSSLFGYPMGPMNDLLMTLGITQEPVNFLVSKTVARNIVIFIQTWMWYGATMINMISGILGISPDIFEAADIDGANSWQVFWKITIPSIRTIFLFTLVTSLIGGLTMFDIPQLFVPNGGPDNANLTTSVFIYSQAFKGAYMYNRASAASMIMFVIIIILSAVMFFILRDKDEAAMKKMKKAEAKAAKRAARAEKLAAMGGED